MENEILIMKKHSGLVTYFILLALAGGATALFAVPNLVLAFAFITLGVGFILAAAVVNIFVAMLALMPMVLLGFGGNKRRGLLGLLLGAIGYGAYLFGPEIAGNREVEKARAALLDAQIHQNVDLQTLRSFELQLVQKSGAEACKAACKSLLIGGHADWVRVVPIVQNKSKYAPKTGGLLFETASGAACAGGPSPCIISVPDTGKTALVLVTATPISGTAIREFSKSLSFSKIVRGTQIEVIERRNDDPKVIFRQANLRASVPASPTVLMPAFQGMESAGYTSVQKDVGRDELRIFDALRTFGFDLKVIPDVFAGEDKKHFKRLPTATDMSLARRVLDQNGSSDFAPEDQQLLSNYVTKARWFKELPAVHMDLLERIIKDPRVSGVHNMDQVLRNDRAFRDRVLPWIFESLADEKEGSKRMWLSIGTALRSYYTPAELAPYYETYLTFYREERLGIQMSDIMGRFGQDPSEQFAAAFDATPEGLALAVKALCQSESRWQKPLSGQLLNVFEATESERKRLDYPFEKAGNVLAALGHYDAVERRYQAEGWAEEKTLKRLRRNMDFAEQHKRPRC